MVELEQASQGPNPEAERFVPALTMRPHHFFKPFVRNALQRHNGGGIKLVDGRVTLIDSLKRSRFSNTIDQANYLRDVLGNTEKDRKKFQAGEEDYLTRLWELPNESFIHLDLQRDGICKAACIGAHCTGLYIRGEQIDNFNGEINSLLNIERKLKEAGYKLGEDWAYKETFTTLYDYEHRSLRTRGQVTPVTVNFPSLIVRAGALRKI